MTRKNITDGILDILDSTPLDQVSRILAAREGRTILPGMTVGDVLAHKEGQTMPRDKFWMGSVPEKDDFGLPITDEFIDGKTTMGPWATMSPFSFQRWGISLGTGRGQKYQKQLDGRWKKVEG